MTQAAFAIHRMLVEDEGFDAQTDEYYSEIDKRLINEFPQKLGSKTQTTGEAAKLRQPKLPHPATRVDAKL